MTATKSFDLYIYPDCTLEALDSSASQTDATAISYTIYGAVYTKTIVAFTTNTYCAPVTYAMTVDNSTYSNIIAFDDSTRVLTIDGTDQTGDRDNQFGDTDYAITITGTNSGSQTATITFNVNVAKDCTQASVTIDTS